MLKRLLGLLVFVFAVLLFMSFMTVSAETEAVCIPPPAKVQWLAVLPPGESQNTYTTTINASVKLFTLEGFAQYSTDCVSVISPATDANGITLGDSSYFRAAYTAFRLSESAG